MDAEVRPVDADLVGGDGRFDGLLEHVGGDVPYAVFLRVWNTISASNPSVIHSR